MIPTLVTLSNHAVPEVIEAEVMICHTIFETEKLKAH